MFSCMKKPPYRVIRTEADWSRKACFLSSSAHHQGRQAKQAQCGRGRFGNELESIGSVVAKDAFNVLFTSQCSSLIPGKKIKIIGTRKIRIGGIGGETAILSVAEDEYGDFGRCING